MPHRRAQPEHSHRQRAQHPGNRRLAEHDDGLGRPLPLRTTGAGDDIIRTGDGANVIETGIGADTIIAGGGNGLVTVSGGADTSNGGAGVDTLTASCSPLFDVTGAHDAFMFSRAGNDVLIFSEASETAVGSSRDQIYDFTSGEDHILIFVSMAERYARMIADEGIASRVSQEEWKGAWTC